MEPVKLFEQHSYFRRDVSRRKWWDFWSGGISAASTKITAWLPKKPRSSLGGEITHCFLNCFNNSRRNKELSISVLSSNPKLRTKRLRIISRRNFVSLTSHHVCSVHFEGVAKTYINNVLTIVPKNNKIRETKVEKQSKLQWRNFFFLCLKEIQLQETINDLENKISNFQLIGLNKIKLHLNVTLVSIFVNFFLFLRAILSQIIQQSYWV